MKDDGVIQDKFRRRDIDCVIRLDATQLFDDDYKIFISDANVALIPRDVPVEYIQHVTLLKQPRFTVYSRPKQKQLDACETEEVTCRSCGAQFRLGTWWCLSCWEPMTIAGINDRQSFLANDHERRRELKDRYGLTPAEFEELREQPGSSIANLTVWSREREPGVNPTYGPPRQGL